MGERDRLRIRMLGGCSLSYGDRTIDDNRRPIGKPWLLLEYLVTFRNRHIPFEELIGLLYPDGGGSNPTGALKTLVYRMRAMLEELGLPDSREVVLVSRGSYAWNTGVPMELDADLFEQACQRASAAGALPEERLAACREAAGLYRGDFLDRSAGERWVLPLASYYRNLYKHTVHTALELLESGEQWEELAALCTQAIKVDGYDESFHFHLVRALTRMGQPEEALERYKRMHTLFYTELGVTPPAEVTALYQDICRERRRQAGGDGTEEDLESISRLLLRGGAVCGAFLCEPEVFREIYNLEARAVARAHRQLYLALLSAEMRDGSQPPLQLLNAYMDRLADCLRESLRRGDVVSRYSANQYLLLLPTPTAESGRLALGRIITHFVEKYPRCPLLLRPSIRAIDQVT